MVLLGDIKIHIYLYFFRYISVRSQNQPYRGRIVHGPNKPSTFPAKNTPSSEMLTKVGILFYGVQTLGLRKNAELFLSVCLKLTKIFVVKCVQSVNFSREYRYETQNRKNENINHLYFLKVITKQNISQQ